VAILVDKTGDVSFRRSPNCSAVPLESRICHRAARAIARPWNLLITPVTTGLVTSGPFPPTGHDAKVQVLKANEGLH